MNGRLGATLLALAGLSGCGMLPFSHTSRVGAELIETAAKPSPVDSEFEGCGPAGSQPDYAVNRLKNRVDEGTYLPLAWSVVAKLPWPRQVGYRFRNQWTQSERDAVNRYEGAAVQVEGFVTAFRLEIPEPPNCYASDARHKDYHIWLSEGPDSKKARSIVVEITPRIRAKHAAWTEDRLAALDDSQARVRISGWLMLDQMHPERVGANRITLWEVHPITHIEVQRADSSWVPLDSLQVAPDSTN